MSSSSVTYGASAPTLTPSNFATITGYSSLTTGTATINGSGVISIAGAGTTTFTVTGTDQCGNSVNVTTGTFTVNKADISPSLSYTSTTLTYGGGNSSTPTISGNTGSGTVTYSVSASSPSGCATVNESTGVVTPVSAGAATITATIAATTNYNGGTATTNFTINKATPTKYDFSVDKTTLCGEETATLTLEDSEDGVTYELRSDATHSIADTQKAGTGSALAWTGLGAGNYVVYAVETANYEERQMNSSKITVTTGTATSITTQPTNREVTVGEEATLTVVAAGTSLSYQWKESATEDGTYSNVASSGTSASYSVTPAVAGTKWYKCVVTGTCGEVTTEARKIVANAAKITPTVTWTTVPSTVYKGGKYAIEVSTNTDASLVAGNLTCTNGTLSGVAVSDGVFTGYLEIATNASSAPTLTLTTSAGSTYAAKTETNDDIELGSCEGGGGSTIYSYTITSTSDVTGGSATGGSVDINGLDDGATAIDEVDYYKIGGDFSLSKRYIKITLSGTTLAAGDVITLFDAVTSDDKGTFILYDSEGEARYTYGNISTKNVVTEQKYTITAGDGLVGSSVFYIGRNGSNGRIRTITITRPGGGSSQTTNLTWSGGLVDEGSVDKTVGDANFTYTASSNNSNGAISYSSGTTSVATINSNTGEVTIENAGSTTITATIAESGCYPTKSITYTLTVTAACEDVVAPTELICSTAGVNSLAFSWTAASNASSYDVYLYSDEECTSPVTPTEGSPYNVSTTSATLTGLTASTTYYCQVQSKGDGTTYCAAGGTTSAQSGTTTCTSITPTWSYFTTTVGKGITLYPTIGGNTGSGTVTYSSSNTTNITNALYANTASASATITANVAANGNYCSGSVTSSSISVVADQTGLIKQSLNYGNSTAWGTPSAPATSGTYASDITSTTAIAAYGTDYTIATTGNDGNNNNDGQTGKVPSLGSYDASKYVAISFTVASGKKLNVSAIYIPVQPVSKDYNNFKAVLTDDDDETDDIVGTISNIPNGKLAYIPFSSYGSVTGNVTLKIYAWGNDGKGNNWTAGYRFGKSIVIDGETESTATLYDISTSATNGTIAVTVGGASASSAEEDATVTITATPSSGYSFSSWSVAEDDSGDPVSVTSSTTNPTTFTMPAAEVTVSATFTPNTYGITYYLNGASWAGGYSAPANYTVGTGATLPIAANMTNTGYTFGGWFADDDLETGGVVTAIGTSEYGDKEFWAKWTENTYTITYNKNNGSASGSTAATEGHYVTVASCGFELDGYLFTGWNTKSDGTGESYGAGEDIELTANMTLYAQWATDYTITWGNVQIGGAGETVKPNLGGGNYTITANTGSWTGSLDASMISSETSGVTITKVAVSNGGSPKTITVTFAVGAEVVGESIGLTLSVPAAGVYSAKSDTKAITIDRCTGSGGGSDGVLFSAEFKDSGLGTSDICTAANTAYTFTTAELKAAPTGGSIKAFSTSNLSHMKYATNAISIAGSDGVIQIDLSNAIATNDLFTYLNVNSSTSSAYLRHTSPTTTTDQIALTVYNSKEAKVRLTSGFNGKKTLYIVRNSSDFKLHKAAVVRPAFLMLLRDDTPTSDTNLEGTDQELTTLNYLTTINGGRAYYTSPSSGNLKIKRSSSKNYINFNNAAGYVKIVLTDALQEGDVIGFDSYNTNNLALTTTDVRSTSIVTTNQLYTVGSSSPLKGQTTFYLWQNSGSSDYLRGLQIARSGVAGGGGGTDQITTTLSWDPALNTDPDWNSGENRLNKETGDADFTFAAVPDKNSLGALTYSSSNTDVATVTAGGTVHIVGAAGDATITAAMAESGCYKGATISYNIHVEDNCDDTPGHVMAYDLGCDGTLLVVVLYDGMDPEAVNYQWYRDGASLGESYRAQRCTVTVAGEYYVVVDNTAAGVGHCAMASDNTVEVEARAGISAEKIVDQWYVKNGRRTPDVELVQTTGATGFVVKIGETTIWNSDGTVTTGFGGCGFRLGENGIIYLNGQADNHSAPDGLSSGDVTLTITAKGCGSDADPLEIEIHCQASTDRKSVAFVVDGTEKGTFAQADADHSTNSALYQFLDYTLSGGSGKFDLTAQNIYSSVDEKELREHYSQFDAIIITDDPSTGKKKDGKSYVNAFGTMIDVRPILTMEAFVSKLANWKAKGINGNPESPSSRQYAMTLQCKDHEIFFGIDPTSPNVAHEEIDGVDYWTVTMVDKTKSPYSSKASDTDDTEGTPALQGFSASDVSGLLLLGEIKNGDKTMYTGVERQEEPAARLMLLGIQNKALPNALTTEGKTIIENAVGYLLKTNMEEVDDCSNYFIGGGGDNSWETNANWFKGKAPNSPMIRVRILAPCEVSTTIHAAHIDIVTSGESSKKGGEMTGQLTIKPNGAVIVGGEVRAAEAPYFNKSDLKPTEEQDLKIETSAEGQGALILNNDAGDTKATVEYYSLGRKDGSVYQFQYFASPMGYLEINPAFAGAGIYTYAWNEAVADGWERRAYYTDVLGFEGLAITTKRDYNSTYNLKGALASTADVDIPLTYTDAGAGGQNLIGNSWTAPINIASLVEAFEDDGNVTKTVNIYNSGNEEYPGLGTAGTWTSVPISVAAWPEWTGLKVIPAMQAFRIDVTSETKLTMNYEKMVRQMESSSLNEPLKAPRRRSNANGASLMRMRLESGNAYTDLFLIEGEQFSEAFDNGYEAKFIAGEDNTVQFYAMNGEEKMAVLATDALEGTQVGFVPGKGTAYTISFSGDGMGYYLNDLKLMTSTLINEEATYSFTFEEGDANRFYISRTPIEAPQTPTGVDNTHSGEVKAQKFIYNGKMYIMINGRVYSADGQIVK